MSSDCKWHLVKESYIKHNHIWSMDRISHNNIKPQNILLDDNLESLVLCDFAHSTEISENLEKQFGTATFMAPEINEFTLPYSAAEAEVFAFGSLIFFIFYGCAPFNEGASSKNPLYKLVIEGKKDEFFREHEKKLTESEVPGLNNELR